MISVLYMQTESFYHYERMGIGHKSDFNYRNLQLIHNQLYFFNFYLKNVMCKYAETFQFSVRLLCLNLANPPYLKQKPTAGI